MNYLFARIIAIIRSSFVRSYQAIDVLQVPIGCFFFVAYALYYYIWTSLFPYQQESLVLRIVGMILSIGLIFKKYWPKRWQNFKPVYCYVFIAYGLTFFPTYLLFMNAGAIFPLIMVLVCFFLLILLCEWIVFNTLFFLGIIAAILLYRIMTGMYPLLFIYEPYIAVYVFMVVAASLFSYRTLQLREKMSEGMAVVGINIAHELRTPLLGIKAGAVGIERYVPRLFEGYELAKQHGLKVPEIRKAHYDTILPTLQRIQSEANYANTVIDMLLINVNKQPENETTFSYCSMRECIQTALNRYPFTSETEKNLIHFDATQDFIFYGSAILMVHVLFNLIKNALYFIAKANKGEITIRLATANNTNILYFKDTGTGIPRRNLLYIFERFYTTTGVGAGVGLPFCKTVIESFDGRITCNSMYGEYAEFIIRLPMIEESRRNNF